MFAITPDPAARIQKLASGECLVSVFPRPADLDVVERNPSLTLVSGVGRRLQCRFRRVQTQHKPLDQIAVRRALDMAIDKPAIIQAVFSGNATVATNPMPPAQWSYDEALKDAPFDPSKAKALLAQAGFPNGFDLTLWAIARAASVQPERATDGATDPAGLGEDRRTREDRQL